jgi:hypothetical protein
MKHLRGDFDAFRAEWRSWCKEHNGDHKDADDERKTMGNRITTNEERLRNTTGVLGAVQAASFALSTWLGTRF